MVVVVSGGSSRGRAQRFLLIEGFWLSRWAKAKVGCSSANAKKIVVVVTVVRLV